MRKLIMILAAATSLAAATPASADTVADWWDFANRVSNAAGVQTGMGTRRIAAPSAAPRSPCSRRSTRSTAATSPI